MSTRNRVGFLVFDGAATFETFAMREALRLAVRAGANYDLVMLNVAGAYSGGGGTDVRSGSFGADVDTVIIPGPADPDDSCDVDQSVRDAARWVASRARRVVALGSGAFVLAQAGVLSGRKATTHWRHVAALAGRYPDVSVEPFGDVVVDRDVYTTGSPAAVIDAAVRLIEEDFGRRVAAIVADDFVGTSHSEGYAATVAAEIGPRQASTPLTRLAMTCIFADPSGVRNVQDLAEAVGVSTRHLSRAMRDELGTTPHKYLEQVRVDLAKRFLRDGYTVTDTAMRCGFGSTESLRRAFTAAFGMPAAQYQRVARGGTVHPPRTGVYAVA